MNEKLYKRTARTARLAPWIHTLSLILGLLVLLTIFFGSAVTSREVGDSDPTWNPFLFFRWWREASGGLAMELDHRKFGTFLGILALTHLGLLYLGEARRGVRVLGYWVFVAICLQGVLGGVRVLSVNHEPTLTFLRENFSDPQNFRVGLAMAHGFLAQLILAGYLWIFLQTKRPWRDGQYESFATPLAGKTQRSLVIVCYMLAIQLILGTFLRHDRDPLHTLVWFHLGWGICTAAVLLLVGAKSRARHPEAQSLNRLTGLARTIVIIQVFLGFLAWAFVLDQQVAGSWDLNLMIRAAHQINGALLLAVSISVALRARLVLRACPPEESVPSLDGEGAVL